MNPARLILVLILLIGLLGGLVNGAAIYSKLIYVGIVLALGTWVWAQMVSRALFIKRNARTLRASLGDIFIEHFEIKHTGRLIASWVEIVNESPIPYTSGSRLLTLINPGQTRSYLSRTWLRRRGNFSLGPTRITTGDPFGFFRVTRRITARQSLIVLPMIQELRSFFSPPGLLPGGRVIHKKAIDITPHASGIREYVSGDALKRIHWPTSLRRGELMVKEFEQDPQAEVWLILDAQASVHTEKLQPYNEPPLDALMFGRRPKFQLPASTLEYAICITASLAHYFIQQRRAVGMISAGRVYTYIPAERSSRQEGKILETLAFVEASGSLSLAELVATQTSQLPQGSSAILITPTTSNELFIAVDHIRRRYLRPMVILLAVESFGSGLTNRELAAALERLRIPTCFVAYGDDVGGILPNFSPQDTSQEIRTWQRPPLSHLT